MKRSSLALAVIAAIALTACAARRGPIATATLSPTTGSSTVGVVQFTQRGDRLLVAGEVRGLRRHGEHGFHVHERGDCSGGDGERAGGHYNPNGAPHGQHGAGRHHAGDLPSLIADAAGVARFSFETNTISVGSGPADVVGKGLIVHRDPDDFISQPSGNAGRRLACAVILF